MRKIHTRHTAQCMEFAGAIQVNAQAQNPHVPYRAMERIRAYRTGQCTQSACVIQANAPNPHALFRSMHRIRTHHTGRTEGCSADCESEHWHGAGNVKVSSKLSLSQVVQYGSKSCNMAPNRAIWLQIVEYGSKSCNMAPNRRCNISPNRAI